MSTKAKTKKVAELPLDKEELILKQKQVNIDMNIQKLAVSQGKLVSPKVFVGLIDEVFNELQAAIAEPSKELLFDIVEIFARPDITAEMRLILLKTRLIHYYREQLNCAADAISEVNVQRLVNASLTKVAWIS